MSATVMFTGKTYSKFLKKVRAKNRRFAKKTRKEQRIAIANDVIQMLSTKKIQAMSTYLRVPGQLEDKLKAKTSFDSWHGDGTCDNVDASAVMAQTSCQVCGIGSLFVSALQNNDKMKLKDFTELVRGDDTRDMEVEYLRKWFDADQLDLVETYYELNGEYDYASPISDEISNNRLKMIMENIVSNGGRFDPYKGAHKVPDDAVCEVEDQDDDRG